jgi:hypothetical protein
MSPLTTIIVSAVVGYIAGIFTLKHRLQAENEYTILMKIWNKAYWLKSRANNLRPKNGDTGNPNAPDEKQKRLDAFDEAKDEFDKEMYLNKPFYPDGIYLCLRELGKKAVFEAIDYHHGAASPDNTEYWIASDASAAKINDLVDQLCDSIRCQIHGRIMYRFWQFVALNGKSLDWLLSLATRPFKRLKTAAE